MKTEGWKSIDWRKAEKYVFKLQKRIYAASRRGDVKRCRKLQRTLMSSWSNRVIAVRRVTVENQGKQLFPTSDSEAGARTRATGTPQGGVISPLLANIALHGMEERINKAFPEMSQTMRETWYHKKGTKFRSPQVIRYADDFVILHKDITVVQRCREIISEWLIDMGLELKPSKTRLTHTLNEYGSEKPVILV
ncbi:MAG: reverse transcriptase N-terminal domain-containing protein [Nostoc sp.]